MSNSIETVQHVYAEFGKGNIPGVVDLLTDDVVWIDPGKPFVPYAGTRTGKKEVMDFFSEMGKTIEFSNFEPRHFTADGNMVYARGVFAGHSRATGKPFESPWVMLWEIANGKVKRYEGFIDTANIANSLK